MPRELQARERFGVGDFIVELEAFDANGQAHLMVKIVKRNGEGFKLVSPAPEAFESLSQTYHGFGIIFK